MTRYWFVAYASINRGEHNIGCLTYQSKGYMHITKMRHYIAKEHGYEDVVITNYIEISKEDYESTYGEDNEVKP